MYNLEHLVGQLTLKLTLESGSDGTIRIFFITIQKKCRFYSPSLLGMAFQELKQATDYNT
jgi:hypothetical protein